MNNNERCTHCGAPKYGRFCNICGAEQVVLLPAYAAVLKPKRNGGKIAFIIFSIVAGIMLFVGGCTAIALSARHMELIDPRGNYLPRESTPDDNFEGEYYEDFSYGYTNRSTNLLVEALHSKRIVGTDENLATPEKSYFVVTLRLSNIGSEIITYDASTFEVCDATGNLSASVVTEIDKGTALGSGRLLPSGTIEGTVVFMVKTNAVSPMLYIEDEAGEVICFPLV